MSSTVKQKYSTTAGNVPSSLAQGQFGINLVDKRVFTANATQVFDAIQNTVVDFAITNNAGAAFRVGNSSVNCVTNSSSITLANSTVTWTVVKPTAAQVTDGGYFPASDGSWKKPAGGSGSPGGSNTNIQYDDSGSFNGSNSFNFDNTSNTVTVQNQVITGNLTVNSDYISLGNSTINSIINSVAITVPVGNGANNITAPTAANSLSYFGKYKAQRILPVTIGSSGWDTPLQGHFLHNTIYQLLPTAGAATATATRLTSTITTTATARVASSANLFMSQTRMGHSTGATAGTTIGWKNGTGLPFWRGNAAGLGGFYAVARFGVAQSVTNGRAFIGFKDSTTNLANGNPSAQTNIIGFGWDSGATTLSAMSANATTSNTIDLGADITTGNTNWYEAVIFAPPNGGNVSYQLTNLTTGNTVFGQYNQTNLPSTTTFLTWQFWGNNGASASAEQIDWGGVQIEVNL